MHLGQHLNVLRYYQTITIDEAISRLGNPKDLLTAPLTSESSWDLRKGNPRVSLSVVENVLGYSTDFLSESTKAVSK
jgi:hypothetical protein